MATSEALGGFDGAVLVWQGHGRCGGQTLLAGSNVHMAPGECGGSGGSSRGTSTSWWPCVARFAYAWPREAEVHNRPGGAGSEEGLETTSL